MTGVEILATEEVAIEWANWNWGNFWTVVFVFFLMAMLGGVICGMKDNDLVFGIGVFLLILLPGSAAIGIPVGFSTGDPIAYETQYKVTIDDSVSMNEFLDQYEILDQDGKIYTVREKNK